ncbi:hypothetical protein ACFDR9_001807 [Janthinobacterium sp. CG_23.3]|uniref:hypothetical protein n=1 Tax=Janthinobacterium sp. CG_23.3 TaxID=3349634 RepID=UPI0038D414DC
MGYHVSIVRTKNGQPLPISKDEVEAALAGMGGRLAIDRQHTAGVQLFDTAKGDGSELLILQDGELWSSSPGEPFVALMIELAQRLGARVRGEEFETYRSVDEVYDHPDDAALRGPAPRPDAEVKRSAAWGEWRGRLIAVGIWMLIGLVFIVGSKLFGA